VRRQPSNLVLAYQGLDDAQRESTDRLWTGVSDVLAYFVVWSVVGAVFVALLGSAVLWGVLIANAAQ
jgi:hypothetical protein